MLGFFSWFYPARYARAQILSLKGREFVEAARMIGASELRILRTHLLPYLAGPLSAYAAVLLAQNILAEAGLPFLGYGIKVPTASVGNLLSSVWNVSGTDPSEVEHFFHACPLLFVLPLLAIFSIVLALAVLADALRGSADAHGVR